MAGVVQQHRDRMANDEHYRQVALTAPSTKRHHNSQGHTDGTAAASGDAIDQLSGDDLEQAVRDADIAGRSSMTADEKRAALRAAG